MVTEKEVKTMLKLLAQVSSDYGDGVAACQMLQKRLDQNHISIYSLQYYADRYPREYGYISSNFWTLANRYNLWRTEEAQRQRDEREARRFDPNHDHGEYWQWVKGHTRISKDGKVIEVRGHWRMYPRAKAKPNQDPNNQPGPDYRWIAPHTRYNVHRGQVQVKGYWRKSSLQQARRAA